MVVPKAEGYWTKHGRFTDAAIFVLPVHVDRMEELDALDGGTPPDSSWIDPDIAEVVQEIHQDGAHFCPVPAGRGASGVAVGLEILGVVADAGGAIAFLVGAAALTKRIWTKLQSTKRGIISLSSGAAALLALHDAASRLTSANVRLVSFGAVDQGCGPSYSEFDLYWAVIEVADFEVIEFYLITDQGNVTFAGRAARPVSPHDR
ncbi:hypothetical protein [Catelliglobosispora koreensis]|uniref:hypothetical protein n=1 Tax=Catelliglobosispora koreensis TaxID=129052 RepID=UPI0003770D5D|nr:hypothetical protein [Catelliglobosispora koreensis]